MSTVSTSDPRAWFREMWLSSTKRWRVFAGYRSIDKLTLTDIALRGCVFSRMPPAHDLFDHGKLEGRRELALEIIKLARVEPQALLDLVEPKPREKAA